MQLAYYSCNLCRYAALAASSGVRSFIRVPTLGLEPEFIDALASVVMEALPDLNQPSMQQVAEIYLPTYPPTYQPTNLPSYLHTFQPTYLPTYTPSIDQRGEPTFIPIYLLPTYSHRSTRGTRWRSTS